MKAVILRRENDVGLESVPDPTLSEATDAIVQMTMVGVSGQDLRLASAPDSGVRPGTVLGRQGIGVVQEVGSAVAGRRSGARVIVSTTIACGSCAACRYGFPFARCTTANPRGVAAGPSYFGGPECSGPFDGLHAEFARVPHASAGLRPIPDEVTDEQAVLMSETFPTAYFGAKLAEICAGDTVCVLGAGAVGQLTVFSARILGAGRVIVVDEDALRLDLAARQGAETVDASAQDPVEKLMALTGGRGVGTVVDTLAADALDAGPPAEGRFEALEAAVRALANSGTLCIIAGSVPRGASFPIGEAIAKNLTIKMGSCNHAKYVPTLCELVRRGAVNPYQIVGSVPPVQSPLDAYEALPKHPTRWIPATW